ncbi:hypothetical protein Tco_0639624 [Tanacetum coccineum]
MDTNPSQPSVFTPVVAEMHKEDQQGTTRPASLGVSGEKSDLISIVVCQIYTILILEGSFGHIEQQIEEEFNTYPDLFSSDDAKKDIKLEDLSKLV